MCFTLISTLFSLPYNTKVGIGSYTLKPVNDRFPLFLSI
jgi:hypothetical protein